MSKNNIIDFDYSLDHYIIKTSDNMLAMAGSLRIFGITGLFNIHTPLTLITIPSELDKNINKISCSDKIIGVITLDQKIFIAVNDLLRGVFGFDEPGFHLIDSPIMSTGEKILNIFCTNYAIFITTNINNIYSRGFDNGQFSNKPIKETDIKKVHNSSMLEFTKLHIHKDLMSVLKNKILQITSVDNCTYVLTGKFKLYMYIRDLFGKKDTGVMYKIANFITSLSKGCEYDTYALAGNKIYSITGNNLTLHNTLESMIGTQISYGPMILTMDNKILNSGENRFGRIGFGVADNNRYRAAEILKIYDNDDEHLLSNFNPIRFIGSTKYISYIVTDEKVYISGTSILTEQIISNGRRADVPTEKQFMYFNAYFPTYSKQYDGLQDQKNAGIESNTLPLESNYEISSEIGPNDKERPILVKKPDNDDERSFYYDA